MRCNLCRGLVLRLGRGPFAARCVCCLSTPLHRAMGLALDDLKLPPATRVYELSARGALVRYLRAQYRDVTLSEYRHGEAPGTMRRGVACQDVQRLTYPDAMFDLVTSTEVFEHVADDRAGFREVHRVLAPGGWFVFTVPIADADTTLERAVHRDGRIVHLTAAEYHRDRLRRVLAFRTYGRDIERRLADAGFSAHVHTIDDRPHRVCAVPVVVACKAPAAR